MSRCLPFLGQSCSDCSLKACCGWDCPSVSCSQTKWVVLVPACSCSVPSLCNSAISAVGGQHCAFAVTALRAGRQPQNLRLPALLQLYNKPSTFSSADEATLGHLQSKAHLLRSWQGCVYVPSAQHGGRRCCCGLWPFSGWNWGNDPANQRRGSYVHPARWSSLAWGLCMMGSVLFIYIAHAVVLMLGWWILSVRYEGLLPSCSTISDVKRNGKINNNTWDKQMQH